MKRKAHAHHYDVRPSKVTDPRARLDFSGMPCCAVCGLRIPARLLAQAVSQGATATPAALALPTGGAA